MTSRRWSCAITGLIAPGGAPGESRPSAGQSVTDRAPCPDRSLVHAQVAPAGHLDRTAPPRVRRTVRRGAGSALWIRDRRRKHGSWGQPTRGFLPIRERRLARADRDSGGQIVLRDVYRAL